MQLIKVNCKLANTHFFLQKLSHLQSQTRRLVQPFIFLSLNNFKLGGQIGVRLVPNHKTSCDIV